MLATLPPYLAGLPAEARGDPGAIRRFDQRLRGLAPELRFGAGCLAAGEPVGCEAGARFTWPVGGPVPLTLEGAWEAPGAARPLAGGDVLAFGPAARFIPSRAAEAWWIQSRRARPGAGTIVRLDALPDRAGGCNPGENAFRRLQIPWEEAGTGPDDPDGRNILGCHVVWIAAETSRAHHHPVPPVSGGRAQQELYLVLDPGEHGLERGAREPGVWTRPDPHASGPEDFTPLAPGDALLIPAPVVHRAVAVLACVIGIPGFKPGNEVYEEA